MATLAQLLAFYQDRLAVQYRTKPKARATIAIVGKQIIADDLARQIALGFSVDTAVGAQLDIIGKYVGIPRNIGLAAELPFFGFWDSEITNTDLQNPNGMTDSTDSSINAQAVFFEAMYLGSRNTDLTDSAYRFMIKLKIILNSNDGTLSSIMGLLELLLPGVVSLVDNADMSISYTLTRQAAVDPNVIRAYLPKPMGVGADFFFFAATAAPDSYVHTFHLSAPQTVVSIPITATPAHGSGPYTYQWFRVSSTRVDFLTPYANTPNAATTTISQRLNGLYSGTSTWVCFVTDAAGLVAQSNLVTITMGIDGPP